MAPSGDAAQAWHDVAAGVLAHVPDARRYGVSPGAVPPWADAFCTRMAGGSAPRTSVTRRPPPASSSCSSSC